jgi:hypothetical protein
MQDRSSKKKKRRDVNELAANIISEATSEDTPQEQPPEESPQDKFTPENEGKNPAAVALGRLGGLKGGNARAKKLTKEQRSEAARKAAKARWGINNTEDSPSE